MVSFYVDDPNVYIFGFRGVGGDVAITKSPTTSPSKSPSKTPTTSPTHMPTTADPTDTPTDSPTTSPSKSPTKSADSCPGVLGEDFCVEECVPCRAKDDDTGEEISGCVYNHEVGKGRSCSLQCIGCGGTCGLANANGNGKGKSRPMPGCNGPNFAWESCRNAHKYVDVCA